MSGVWKFNDGVIRLVENPQANRGGSEQVRARRPSKVLVHLPSGQVISSYQALEQILKHLGWENYLDGDRSLYQFHRANSIDLISLPRDFSKFSSVHMYDLVVKHPNVFQVRDT
ncbi:unnamed protein product [Amaranthus hypochondriacus]